MQRADEKQSSALKICCTVGEKDIEKIQKKIQNLLTRWEIDAIIQYHKPLKRR